MRTHKEQFQLPLTVTKCRPRRPKTPDRDSHDSPERLAGIDQVLGTHDVERITGRHRCTIYRWVRAGTFPDKRAGGGRGWLRSDVERWLNGDRPSEQQTSVASGRAPRAAASGGPASASGRHPGDDGERVTGWETRDQRIIGRVR